MQSPLVSIVVTTVGRPSLLRAVLSIYDQDIDGNIQILIGVDYDALGMLDDILRDLYAQKPAHVQLVVIFPGASTSSLHGGVHSCGFGGGLRSALTFLSASQHVIYLDDDDWLQPDHFSDVLGKIEDKHWCFAYSIYCDDETSQPVILDAIESVGPNKGIYAAVGGFVRPSGLLINKLELLPFLHLWSLSMFPDGTAADRMFFNAIRERPYACTERGTVCCTLDPADLMHSTRLEFMKANGVTFANFSKSEPNRSSLLNEGSAEGKAKGSANEC